jgi:hypothetical protein
MNNETNTTNKILLITRDGELDTDYIKAKQASIRKTQARQAVRRILSHVGAVLADMGHDIATDVKIDYYDTCKGTNLRETIKRQEDEERLKLLKQSAGIIDSLNKV